MAIAMDDVPRNSGSSNGYDAGPKPSEIVDLVVLSKTRKQYRLHGSVQVVGGHWVNSKRPTKENKRPKSFWVPCANWDLGSAKRSASGPCCWCKYEATHYRLHPKSEGEDRPFALSRFNTDHYINALDVDAFSDLIEAGETGENHPGTKAERASGFRVKGTATVSPWSVLRMSENLFNEARELKDSNVHGGEEKPVTDQRYGCCLGLKYDKDAVPAKQYSIVKGESMSIKKAATFLTWDIESIVPRVVPEELVDVFIDWAGRMGITVRESGSDNAKVREALGAAAEGGDDDDYTPAPSSKKRRPPADEDDIEDAVIRPKRRPSVEEDEDEPAPKPKRRPPVDEDEDEPAPKPKRRAPVDEDEDEPAPKPKRRPPVDEDEEEEAPPPKKRRPPVDEEDEEPAPKPKRRTVEEEDDDPPPKPKRRPPVDEDDEPAPPKKRRPPVEEEDEEPAPKPKRRAPADEEDEDFAPAAKKPAAKKPAAKKPAYADDDDDDIPY